jgi:uncharacterized protein YodC (DUF2158 family)
VVLAAAVEVAAAVVVVVAAAAAAVAAVATGEVLVVETGDPRATISKVGHSRTTNSRVGKVKCFYYKKLLRDSFDTLGQTSLTESGCKLLVGKARP